MIPTLLHLGGIDEIGVFLVPVVLAILALRWTEQRAKTKEYPAQEDDDSPDQTSDPDSGNK